MPESIPSDFEQNQSDDLESSNLESLYESAESREFPFPGIENSAYERQRADDENFPGFCTPIDDLIKRFQSEGIKVIILENDSQFIIPAGGPDTIDDRIRPKILEITDGMDEVLKKLILLDRQR